jgi:ATP-dependent Clp protease ATP-binding subunit ClpC
MFERFTDQSRRVIVEAQNEVRGLNHHYVGTEHLLLGFIRVEGSVASKALIAHGISLESARAQVEKTVGKGDYPPSSHIPFTPRCKKVLELSLREAMQLGHNYIGTEHLLLAFIREGGGVGADVFRALDGDLNKLRREVVQLLIDDGRSTAHASAGATQGERTEAEIRAEISFHEVAILRLNAELEERNNPE